MSSCCRRVVPVLAVLFFVLSVGAPRAHAQTTISPYFMVILDNSGSMTASTGGGNNSCGRPRTRMNDARCVLQRVVNGYGEVTFGLERYTQTQSGSCSSSACSSTCGCGSTHLVCNTCDPTDGSGCPASGSTAAQGQILVPIAADNQPWITQWIDFSCANCTRPTYPWALGSVNPEFSANTWTPIAGSLRAARRYYLGSDPDYPGSPLAGDPAGTCRPVNVILLTDGEESCAADSQTVAAATELRSTTVGGVTYDIRTYVVAFGVPAGTTTIENVAIAGGTDAPGAYRGYYATDETSLALAFSQIIEGSIRYEVCNGVDDNCNMLVDEGFTLYCDRPASHPAQDLCTDPGETVCNGTDDNCNGLVDEGFTLYCNRPAGVSTRSLCTDPGETVCNGVDDNCNGVIDEGVCGGCVPSPEICDGLDNDCDLAIDDGLTRGCGTDVGECVAGTQICSAGAWGTCAGSVGPAAETCNGLDDDCNGVVDGFGRACGSDVGACQAGIEICSAGAFGACMGAVGPTTEVCNNVDDDCDGSTDELNPGGGGSCGSSLGECSPGTLQCMGGALVCVGGVSPIAETCNGLDDNCDGTVDDSVPSAGACGSAVGECSEGALQCVGGAFTCVGARGPSTEVCNGLDDDCDGASDDGNPGGGAACGSSTGVCEPGTLQCTSGTLVCTGGVSPGTESCNGLDDDCDGAVDDGVPTAGTCGSAVGECEPGVLTCQGGTFNCVGARGPVAEICNTLDDDCDGTPDEGNPGGGASCGTDVGECTPGTSQCIAGALECVGGMAGVAESCNTLDDDCDGLVDEGNPGGGGTCGATDVGECDFGALACTGGALVCRGETGPTAERCDGRDNDCDGMTDEMNPEGGVPCGIDTGECTPGVTLCMAGALVCDGGNGPTPEVCNGLDDDCDGVEDEGIPVGAPCGSDVGECSPGVNICRSGGLVCEGQIGPVDEVCNALDDDCDGSVDEALPVGVSCGTDEGVCMTGTVQCVGGVEICVGETPGGPETCDCEDNDCDGMTDEPPDGGSLCPAGTACISCSCSRECVMSEFGPQCPTGTVPETTDGTCWCVRPRCTDEACGAETIAVDGTTVCAPSGDGLGPCVCRNNACTFACDGVVCDSPLVCRPRDGACVSNDCVGLGCPSGELCDVATGACTADPCTPDTCAADQACRAGTCETSCATVTCASGERCERGTCVTDACAGVTCASGEVCDAADGSCVGDACATVVCGEGTVCDPLTGDCEADPCTPLHCPEGQVCEAGECVREVVETDAGMSGMDAGVRIDGGGVEDDGPTRVLAAGGGGCICAAPGASGSSSGGAAASIALAIGLAITVTRRRRSARRGGER